MMSKDVVAVATLLGTLAMLQLMSGVVVEQAGNLFSTAFGYVANLQNVPVPELLRTYLTRCIVTVIIVAGPLLSVPAGAGPPAPPFPNPGGGAGGGP